MLIAVICTDKPGALDIRLANRDAHIAYLAGDPGDGKPGRRPRLGRAGPLYQSRAVR